MIHQGYFRAAGKFFVRSWDDGTAVYHPVSGATHFLDPAAGEALQILQRSAISAERLPQLLAVRLDVEPVQELHRYTERLLGQLQDLGLIQSDD